MLGAHEAQVERAAREGVKVVSFQEAFDQPCFPPSRDARWYDAAERIPSGVTITRCQSWAREYGMVIAAPISGEEAPGVSYNTAVAIDADGRSPGKYRKAHFPGLTTSPEKYFFKPGNLGFPVLETAFCRVGVSIRYDRHFPEGFRALALKGADLAFTPSRRDRTAATSGNWRSARPRSPTGSSSAPSTGSAKRRPGTWPASSATASSPIAAARSSHKGARATNSSTADLDLALSRKVRHEWQFLRDRRPDVYAALSDPATM